jgi:integrase/recombinase XerD
VVNHWIARWLRHAGVARRPGALAHSFRHTAADGWLDTGATLAEVQALLGHASIATTGIYTNPREFHQTREWLVLSVSEWRWHPIRPQALTCGLAGCSRLMQDPCP